LNVEQRSSEQIEKILLNEYERRWKGAEIRRERALRPAFFILLLALIALPMRVPAEYFVEVGKRITFQVDGSDVDSAVPRLFPDLGNNGEIAVQVRRLPDKTIVRVDVWGTHLPSDHEIRDRVRRVFPKVVSPEIEVASLEGLVRNDLMHKLAWELFRAGTSPTEIASARERLIEELRRIEGPDADVQLDTEEHDSNKRIRIQVRKYQP
jgi:hypothetical protein